MSRRDEQLPQYGRSVLSVWVEGQVWSYKEGSTRIYSYDGQEVNVWDHQHARPGIEFSRAAIEQRVREWVADEREADGVPPASTDDQYRERILDAEAAAAEADPDQQPDPDERVRCRSRASGKCYDGRLSSEVYPEDGMSDDGTFDGETVVCDACYIALGSPTSADPATIAGGKGLPHRRGWTPLPGDHSDPLVERFGFHGEDA